MTLKTRFSIALCAGALAIGAGANAQDNPAQQAAPAAQPAPATAAKPNPTVGGVAMVETKTIPESAAAAPNLTTLVGAIKAADLTTPLSGPGPFTVFAPTNDAFTRLPAGELATLMKPEYKATLAKILNYHVVAGALTYDQLKQQIAAGGGTAKLTTVEGSPLTVTSADGTLLLTDVNGNKSYIETPDVRQSNGIVHVVNGVVLPKIN